jgi:hypothetical protein
MTEEEREKYLATECFHPRKVTNKKNKQIINIAQHFYKNEEHISYAATPA